MKSSETTGTSVPHDLEGKKSNVGKKATGKIMLLLNIMQRKKN